jgi:3-deoxy-manno-octulosonate cytidylyltransferase (CMP-KDO synthetase)
MFRVVIPARFAATRLPGKPLAPLAGLPMIQHVHRLASRSGASEVVIATDDERIREACAAFGAAVEITAASHASGTDRIAELAARHAWADESVVVNVQADEPLLPPALIGQAAALLVADPDAGIATLCAPIASLDEYLDPNVVKVVVSTGGRALYFSRAPIPWNRDGAPAGLESQRQYRGSWRHIGIYAYRVSVLRRLAASAPSALEQCERLEQLRALELGVAIVIAAACEAPGPGVDTAADLQRIERLMTGGREP